MSRIRRRTAEEPRGIGEIYADGTVIARARFHLKVVQEYESTPAFGSVEWIPGFQTIEGHITVIDGERDLRGREDLTLHLNDERRRRWQFSVSRGDSLSGYHAVSTSGDGLTPGEQP